MKKQRNLEGQRFGKLTVLKSCGQGTDRHYISLVRCDCGKEYTVPDTELVYGRRTGCRECSDRNVTHGMTKTRLFYIWQSMKQRCTDQNSQSYKYYGARGIQVCDEWMRDFMTFYEWSVKNGYSEELSIDRVDVNGGYCPENCRWADKITQANNKRNNRHVEYKGNQYTIPELSRLSGIGCSTLRNRIVSGWDIETALTLPVVVGRNQYGKV